MAQRTRAIFFLAALLILATGRADAASIVVTSAGTGDTLLQGTVVALPTDGARILYHNPAGISLIRGTTLDYSAYGFSINGRYRNGSGYDEKTAEFGGAPLLFVGTDHWAPWYVGFGLFGSVGSSFNFEGDPTAGIPNRFLGESAVFQLGLLIGREIAPGLRVGVELAPNFGRVRSRYPSPFGPVAFDLYGAGIGGAVGILYQATPELSLGVGYRSPGRLFLSGDADVGAEDDEVDFVFHVPQQLEFGLAYWFSETVVATAAARWTDYASFEDAEIDFDRQSALDVPFIANARSIFRYGAGVEWTVLPTFDLLAGISHEEWMMEEESLSPLLYDSADWYFGFGFRNRLSEKWELMAALSFFYADDRVVTADDNPNFPGRYEFDIPITAGFQIRYVFGDVESPAGAS